MASKANFGVVIALVLSLLALSGLVWAEPNLVSWWEFDEGAGTTAYDSVGGNHGTLINGPLWTSGQIGGALGFDGVDDYVDLGNDSSLKPPLPVTLSAWINLSRNSVVVICLDESSSIYYGVTLLIDNSGHATISIGDGNGSGPAYRRSKTGTRALDTDTWYHVAGVVRGATDMDVYVNGVDDGGTYSGSGGSLAYSSANASIGTSHYQDICFDGKIDDVRVYNRALSAEEVSQLYQEGAGGLVAHWEFDEGSGITAFDSAGDNDGILNGDPEWVAGQVGDYALDFDGDGDCVDFGDIDEFEFGDANFTIAAWFYTQGPHSAYGGYGDVVSKYNYGGDGRQWVVYQDPNGRIDFYTNPTGQWATDEHLWSNDGYQGRWTHIVAVRDGSTKILYIDGAPENTGATAGVVTGKSSKVYVGCRENPLGRGYFFNGMIDDVQVYNRALTAEEIEVFYLEGVGPIAHWEFDEGEGDIAYDSVGNNDGMLNGDPEWVAGQIGDYALDFDGSGDYVSIGNTVMHNLAKGTFMAWAFAADLSETCGGRNFAYIIGANNWIGGELGLRVHGDGGGWASVQNDMYLGHLTFAAGTFRVGSWHHVAMTWDGSDWRLYVNSVEKDSKLFSEGTSNASNTALIGKAWDGCSWNGKIDDVRIYDRALSAEEIRKLYENGSSGRGLPVSPGTAVDNIERAIREKVEAWKKIDDMLKKERQAYEALEQMLRTTDYGNLSYSDIVTARYEIYTAIEQGERSKEALEKSIENLEAALAALGFELVPKASTWLEQAKLAIR